MAFEASFFKSWVFADQQGKLIKNPEGDSILDRVLVPMEDLDDEFEWLKRHPIWIEGEYKYDFESRLKKLEEEAGRLGLSIPHSFSTFFQNTEFLRRLRSPANNRFVFGQAPEALENSPDLFLFPFLFDSQDSNFWYLVLNKAGGHCVATWANLRGNGSAPHARSQTDSPPRYTAPSFREFIYHYRMENEICFHMEIDGKPLTEEMREYLEG